MVDDSQNKIRPPKKSEASKIKKRDRSATEDKLIKAGREIFSKLGFDGATTKMIAKKADINESLIGRYFDGKEGLLTAIVAKFLEEMLHRELPYPPQNNLTSELELYVADRIEFGSQHEDFIKIIFTQGMVNKKFKKAVLEAVPMQLDPRLVSRIKSLFDKGRLKKNCKISSICEEVDTYLGGVYFYDCIMHERDKKLTLNRVQRFMRQFAKIYERE